MKILALLSGGKDSLLALHLCEALGHQVIALGHLIPKQIETDSFMYQSIGSNLVPAISEALECPLILHSIQGTPKYTDQLEYQLTQEDEVEDLARLLEQAKLQFEDLEGVCSGAVWSEYQKNRVEHVCHRLQLQSLAPLWHIPQKQLLDFILESDIEAITVKTASMGLQRQHLGHPLKEVYNDFLKLHTQYGFQMCGEGGEFETLTLDAPLFKKKIILDETETILHSQDIYAPVYLLHPKSWHFEEKQPIEKTQILQTIADRYHRLLASLQN